MCSLLVVHKICSCVTGRFG